MNKLTIVYLDLDDIKNPMLAGGQATATYEVGRRLVQRGHKVTVYCSKYPGYKDRVEAGIEYKHIGINTGNIKVNNALYILTIPFIVSAIKNTDIIIECFTAPISTLYSPLFTKIPVIALPSMFNAAEFSRKYKLPFHWIENFGMKFYKYILPYSEIDTSKALGLNNKINYKIVSQGVDEAFFNIRQNPPKHILYLGRFDIAQKGIDLLVKGYNKIKNKIEYPLILAGHGPDEKKIRKMIAEYGLQDKIKIVGSAYGDKKFELMSEALYTAFPSRHDEICLWALESLAGGLPLICFDIPESKWLNDKISLKARPFDIDEYASMLLSATETKIWQMSNASRIFAKKYSWENVVTQFEQFFYEVLFIESNHEKNN